MTTPKDMERAREIVDLYVKEAFWPNYDGLTQAIASAIAQEREGCADAIKAKLNAPSLDGHGEFGWMHRYNALLSCLDAIEARMQA